LAKNFAARCCRRPEGRRKRKATQQQCEVVASSTSFRGKMSARPDTGGAPPSTSDKVAGFPVQPRRTNFFVRRRRSSHFKELASYERRSCDPDRGRASSPAVLRKRLAPSRVSGGVDGRFICRSRFWSQQARFTFLSLPNRFHSVPACHARQGAYRQDGEREVVSSGAGARARQAHRLTPDTLALEAEAIPRGTPSRA